MPSPDLAPDLARLEDDLAALGMRLVGGFRPEPMDGVPLLAGGQAARTALVIGSAGPDMWERFSREMPPGIDPMDRWTRSRLGPLAASRGLSAVFPFDKPPLPFQRWARRAGPLFPSPLGLLIDPVHGLWHALRGAMLSPDDIPLPERANRPSPCETCVGKPCLAACPVGAFNGSGLDVGRCATHIATATGSLCMNGGCRAREACPVGRASRYPDEQVRFHMDAYRRSVAPHSRKA